MKREEEKAERFKEKLDDACNMHMLKNVLYIKSRFSFVEGFMYRQHEIDKKDEEIEKLKEEIKNLKNNI